MVPRHAHVLTLGIATLWLACGGTAIVDGDDGPTGSGGSGGVSTTSSSSGGGGPTSSSSSSNGVGGGTASCEQACDSLEACGQLEDCVERCTLRAEGPCGDLHQSWLACHLGEIGDLCTDLPAFICSLDEYLDCTGEIVDLSPCLTNGQQCSCSAFVSPGYSIYQDCFGTECECYTDLAFLGVCNNENGNACSITDGCCAGLYFTVPF